MGRELLHVLQHSDRLSLLDRWKIVEEFRERTTAFKVVEQSPHRDSCSDEHGSAPEDFRICMNARNLIRHRRSFG
jgi:hypothetical protein